jgi:hypothetical protein
MRLISFLFLAFLLLAGTASAQTWTKIIDRERQFTMRFPGEPASRDIAYRTAKGTSLPARLYSLERGTARYSVTVVDYSGHEGEEAEARRFAAETIKRKGEVVQHDSRAYQDGLPGDHLTVVARDGRRFAAAIHLFEHRLYIAEASDVKGAANTEPFVSALIITHKDGTWLNLDQYNAEDINAFEDPN